MRPDEIELWREPESNAGSRSDRTVDTVCVVISCCSGAELQIRRGDEILLRELYPDKATLDERAAELRRDDNKAQGASRKANDLRCALSAEPWAFVDQADA